MSLAERRRELLRCARLYLVIDAEPAERVCAAALAGGVDVVQLREKSADDLQIVATARRLRALCDEHDALLIVNDRPDLALECGADGVHVGQDDEPLEQARALIGGDLLLGISTHSPEQIEAAVGSSADYLGVGPVYATPTKEGRAPVGLELVEHAAARARAKPWFAIGGIDPSNAGDVAGAGAGRIAVVRAIRDADDPRAAAAALRAAVAPQRERAHA
jgi:thiamine-phosphate pyrophosphorylase